MEYDLEYGKDKLEIHADAIKPGQKVLMVDDLLATGGTLDACCQLIDGLGGDIVGITVLLELSFLPGREKVKRFGDVHAVISI
jgi:adenine phosphoribosyltransferase